MYKILTLLTLSLVLAISACKKEEPDPPPPTFDCSTVTYSQTIAPIISTSCATAVSCHGAGSALGDFTTHAGIAAAADAGHLKHTVIDDKSMPPSGPLDDTKQNQILCWINAGAPDN